jgi:hypothetical protein
MTRKKFRKMMVALATKVYESQGLHISGDILEFYRDIDVRTMKANSYEEAWEMVKPLREAVGM